MKQVSIGGAMTLVKDRWALVTGASRGVGAQVAAALGKQGCKVLLHSRRLAHTEKLAAQLKRDGVTVAAVEGDLADPAQVELMLDAALKAVPQIDILYNNAAIMSPYRNDIWAAAAEDFRSTYAVNVISLVRICYRLIPGMIARKWGCVVNLTSGIRDQPELMAYSISKGAVDKFCSDLSPRLKGTNVSINALDPGWLRTDMGGPNAPGAVESVIPGALVPVLLEPAQSGRLFRAQDYAGMTLEAALKKAQAV
jgi:3-oxoacyl-[acyl-carrier protein] reductase